MKINVMIIVLATCILSACSVGVNKDLITGLKTANNVLSYEEAYLTTDSMKLNSSEFQAGKTIHLIFDGVDGFTLKDGKVNLGASIVVTDQTGNKVIDFPDLFEAYTTEGVAPENAKSLDLNITINEKYTAGSKYTWKSKVWDKNGKGTITGEIEFAVK